MTSDTTSLVATSHVAANSASEEWRAFGAFLRRPQLPQSASGFGPHSLIAVMRLYALDFLLMTTLGVIAALVVLSGVKLPENMLEQIELSPSWIAVIVIGAPLTEEIIFRSWLSGRPSHLIGGALCGAVIVLLIPATIAAQGSAQAGIVLGIAIALAAAATCIWKWRSRAPLGWFARYFPAIFWAITLGFGLIHLLNYEAAPLATLLPLIVPQVIAGALFGYARVHYGLWAAVLLHALHNGSAVTVALLAESAAG